MSSSDKNNIKSIVKYFSLISQVGLQFIFCVLAGAFIGFKLDSFLGSNPIFFILGLLLGIAGGGFSVYKLIMAAEK